MQMLVYPDPKQSLGTLCPSASPLPLLSPLSVLTLLRQQQTAKHASRYCKARTTVLVNTHSVGYGEVSLSHSPTQSREMDKERDREGEGKRESKGFRL